MATNDDQNNIIKLLKNIMDDNELYFIEFILNNKEQIKALDNYHNSKPSNTKNYYNYDFKKTQKTIIDDLKNDTLFHFFKINSWSELVDIIELNHNMRTLINSGEKPSYIIFKIVVNSFKKIFNEYVSCAMLHFLTSTSDNYLIYILCQWLKQSKTHYLHYYHILPDEKIKLFKQLIDESSDDYMEAIKSINFSTLQNTDSWIITSHPIYYDNSKMYVISTSYDGMGWYKTLAISLNNRNNNNPFVFCMDGGSSGIDRKNNLDFF